VAGYILVWMAVDVLVYVLVQTGSEMAARLSPADRAGWAPPALGALLIAAGLYQFTPIKRVCLNHCRSPLAFIAQHWRDGRVGALAMGLRHGAYCFGCCWALFAVLVAAGVMSMAWMLLLTLVVFVEKMFARGRLAETVTGIALIAVGIVVASGAVAMPWLAQPQ
jgi:predicted metal-binding membrane protein